MTDSKKKTPRKEVDVTDDDSVKPVKKPKLKEEADKLIDQALEEEMIPERIEMLSEEHPELTEIEAEKQEEIVAEIEIDLYRIAI